MSVNPYEFLSIVQAKDNKAPEVQSNDVNYPAVLEFVRSSIASNHSQELSAVLNDEQAGNVLKDLILKYASEFLAGKDYNRKELTERIYQDMAGLGILTKYLYDPEVEEININSFNSVEIVRPEGLEFLYGKEAFSSPEAATDIAKRMVRMGGMLLDAQTPEADSYMESGTRISAMISPATLKEKGVIASIRKQSKERITEQQLIDSGASTKDMLDFLSMCLCYGVSLGVAGGTGSGKTTLMTYLLNEYIQNNDDFNNRVYVIEDSRELNLIDYDEIHDRPARVLYTVTKPAPNPITMFDHIVSSLRFHPALIVPAEVRDEAAYQAAIAGQTGHTILTSFHADSAVDAYRRLVALCTMAGTGLDNTELMRMCISSWPIIVYMKQMKDNKRRIVEVFEATGYFNGKVTGNQIFKYHIDKIERDADGRITNIIGKHEKVSGVSPFLYERLRDNGAPGKLLSKFREG